MTASSGCKGCITGEKASQSVNFVLENKSRKTLAIGLKAPIILQFRKNLKIPKILSKY